MDSNNVDINADIKGDWLSEQGWTAEEAMRVLNEQKKRRDRLKKQDAQFRKEIETHNAGVERRQTLTGEERKKDMEEFSKMMNEERETEKRRRAILCELIQKGILDPEEAYDDNENKSIAVTVNCSDWIYFACGDSQIVGYDELEDLYEMSQKDKKYGSLKWVCKKRQMRPEPHEEHRLKREGLWEEWLDSLPNCYSPREQ